MMVAIRATRPGDMAMTKSQRSYCSFQCLQSGHQRRTAIAVTNDFQEGRNIVFRDSSLFLKPNDGFTHVLVGGNGGANKIQEVFGELGGRVR